MATERPYIETLIAPLMQSRRRWSTQKCPHCECLMPLGEPHHCEAQTEARLDEALREVESQMRGAWHDRRVMLKRWRESTGEPWDSYETFYRIELDCAKKRLRGLARIRRALRREAPGA